MNKNSPNGVYHLNIHGEAVPVYCEMTAGGWIRIFNKIDRTIAFNKSWSEYRDGFGSLTGNHWLGLHNMHLLTRATNMTLRMVLSNSETNSSDVNTIEYGSFLLMPETDKYQLVLEKFLGGNLGDHADYHYKMKFSTSDRDYDLTGSNCASSLAGGWWFNSCFYFCLTCEGTGIAGHYRYEYSQYKFFQYMKMLIKPSSSA